MLFFFGFLNIQWQIFIAKVGTEHPSVAEPGDCFLGLDPPFWTINAFEYEHHRTGATILKMAGSAPALTLNTLCRLWEVGRSGWRRKLACYWKMSVSRFGWSRYYALPEATYRLVRGFYLFKGLLCMEGEKVRVDHISIPKSTLGLLKFKNSNTEW